MKRDVITGLLFSSVSLSAWPRLRRSRRPLRYEGRVNQSRLRNVCGFVPASRDAL